LVSALRRRADDDAASITMSMTLGSLSIGPTSIVLLLSAMTIGLLP
jgi:hypothetical protein